MSVSVSGRARFPLAIKFAVLTFVTMILAGSALYVIIRTISYRDLMGRLKEDLSLLLSSTDWAIAPLLDRQDIRSIQRLVENTGSSARLRHLRLYSPNGAVLASSDPSEAGRLIPEVAVNEVLSMHTLRAASEAGRGHLDYTMAIPVRGKEYSTSRATDIAGVLFVRPSLVSEAGEINAFVNTLAFGILITAVLVILALALFVYLWVLRPLASFMAATHRIRDGDYTEQVVVEHQDEFGSFAAAFNTMLAEVQKKSAVLSEHSEKLELKVAETNEKLLQAQKMEAVGRLAGGVAHDFNNILTGILGYCDIVLTKTPSDQPTHLFIQEIRKAAYRAASLTQQLLAFSRKQVLQPVVLDLNTSVRSLLAMLQRLLGEDIEVRTTLQDRLWPVKADPSKIDQVLINLAVNARDAMPKGGTLAIETRNVSFDADHVKRHPGITYQGDFAMVIVSDTGIGMDREVLSHLFEPFFTTKDIGKGTGLGLSTVYGIVKQSGGYIWPYSEPGRGSTFRIYLPRIGAEEQRSVDHPASIETRKSPLSGRSELILVVEDDQDIRAVMPMVLREEGYVVLVASDGEEALSTYRTRQADIDLVITDVIMPRMNGGELVGEMRRLRPDIKVIFTSGYTADVIAHHGVLDDDVILLEKPIPMKTLVEKVDEVLHHGS